MKNVEMLYEESRGFSLTDVNAAFVENKDPKKNARIIVSTYQALGIDEDGGKWFIGGKQ